MDFDDDVPDAEDINPCTNNQELSNDADWDDWKEQEDALDKTTCLFCTAQFSTIELALQHCKTTHNFNLIELKTKFNMDFHSYIKMINYIRRHKPSASDFVGLKSSNWNSDEYLKPIETESWLMYDFDDLEDYVTSEDTQDEVLLLKKKVSELSAELKQKDLLLNEAIVNMGKMRDITRNIVDHGDKTYKAPNCVGDIPVGSDSDYFNSYAHYGIHLEMLSDTIRTESYRDAILKNTNTFRNKLVLDVGCGTSILSMFAATAGAEKVYAIDQSEVVFKAMDIVRLNNLEDKIELIHGRLEDTKLPHDRVDIIISEWMGYFLLFEGMLDSVIYARENHLKPGGIILPNRCNIQITACSDRERYDQMINYWDDVYGYKMDCMKADVIAEAVVEIVPDEKIIATSSILTEIDINKCTTGAPDFKADFEMKIERSCEVTGLVGYFDTFFDLETPILFSTGPKTEKTHWKQTVFYLPRVLNMSQGDKLSGQLICMRKSNNVRGLSVKICIGNERFEYNID